MKLHARRVAIIAILVALALVLSVFEGALPLAFIPIPGVKLGLSNIIGLFALYFLNFRDALCTLILRCMLASLFGGGVVGLLFSLTGGVLSLCTMKLLLKTNKFSLAGVSIAGAASHGIGQIAVSCLILSPSSVFYLPYLLICAPFTGALTGIIAHLVFSKLNV